MALVNQKTGVRQGQANYVLYRLAAGETLSQCNGSKTTALPAGTCIFYDVTVGNNAVPGETGYGTASAKYQSTVGYDLATGLGSVNVSNLLNQWNSVVFTPTTSILVLTPAQLTHGMPANVSVSVTPNSGSGTPTGDVSLLTDARQAVALFTLANGIVAGTTAALPGGTYNVKAHYAGDANFAPSDSALVPMTVGPEDSTITLSIFGFDSAGHLIPFTSQPYGAPAYLRADTAALSGSGVPSGSVRFFENSSSNSFSFDLVNSHGVGATSQGLFTIFAGQHAVLAQYLGSGSFFPSVSAPVNITVTQAATTTALVSSSSSVIQGSNVTLTATVNTDGSGFAPAGQVSLFSNGVPVGSGSPATISSISGTGNIQTGVFTSAQGTAGFIVTLPVGQNSLTAQYSGDLKYLGSTSAATIVNVIADFAFEAASPAMTIASPGGSGTMVLKVTGQPGYNGVINFSASSCDGLPRESTCSFSPASISGSGSTTLTISTTAAHTAKLVGPGRWGTSFGMTLAGVFFLGTATRRKRSGWLLVSAFAFLITTGGCGGASGGGGTTPDPGTRPGTSTVAVVATAGTNTHVANFSLIVQ